MESLDSEWSYERRTGYQRSVIIISPEDRQFILMALSIVQLRHELWAKKSNPFQDNKCLYEQFDDVCSSITCHLGDLSSLDTISDRNSMNSVINYEPGRTNGTASCFQTNPDCAYILIMIVFLFASGHCQNSFDIVILTHHLKWWYGVPLYTRLGDVLLKQTSLWTVTTISLALRSGTLRFIRVLRKAKF